jgi:uncharacterized protein
VLFEATDFEPDMRLMADAIVECAELVQRAVAMLPDLAKNAAALNEICAQITKIEGEADDTLERGPRKTLPKSESGGRHGIHSGQRDLQSSGEGR